MKRRPLITLAATLLATTSLYGAAPRYNVQPLPPNTLLNNNGLISIPPGLLQPDIRYLSVNDAGEFAGDFMFVSSSGYTMTESTFVWLPSPAHGLPRGFTTNYYIGGYGGNAAINNLGQTAGTFGEAPYFWAPQAAPGVAAGATNVPTSASGGPWAFVRGLNNASQVIGYDWIYPGRLGQGTPFIWSPVATNGLPAGTTYITSVTNATPNAINNRGDVVGVSSQGSFLFLSKPGGGLSPGVHLLSVGVNSINDYMQTVGGSTFWSPSTGLLDLNTLIPSNSGWTLANATQINNRGDIIGTGTYNGQPASFFLTVPEPIVLPAVFLPTLLLSRRPRR